ncbi:hypothetical protein EC973_000097 [Apophysomyces ossiformis]|uniref:Uncharacterized protein n=1 Tax=Apophysomyces ossiformis TaxID=679940 RepID=A0A8H7EUQ5_9FUNG|nr:hypothetical protein EC973_000097 [Apophysomyces ossiformis]
MSNSEQSANLRAYICREVKSLCDADPEVLAQYILALVSTGESTDSLKISLAEKLNEFFDDQTGPFLDRLFQEIEREKAESSEKPLRLSDYSEDEDDGDRNFKHRRPRSQTEDSKRRLPADSQEEPPQKYSRSEGANRDRGSGRTFGMEHRPRCRDYNERGFCMRGDACPYDHGEDRIVVEDGLHHLAGMGGPMAMPPQHVMAPPAFYPMPHNAHTAYDPEYATAINDNASDAHTQRGNMRARGGRGRGRGSGPYDRRSVPFDRTSTTISVQNIPSEMCQLATVNDYFSRFGTITNITIHAPQQKAIIQFSTRAEAEAAHSSPDPIFDNRFVKVFWYRENKPAETKPPAPPTNEPDPELLAARAAEFAKLREEKKKMRQERVKSVLEAHKQKQELLERQIAEQKKLMEKLTSSKDMSRAEKEELLKALKKIAAEIDNSKAAAAPSAPSSATGYGYAPTWPPRRFTLDNRPTSLLVKDIPDDRKEELRKHFEQYGHITAYDTKDNQLIVKYSQRFEAEKALAMAANYVGETLQLSWYTGVTPSDGQTASN